MLVICGSCCGIAIGVELGFVRGAVCLFLTNLKFRGFSFRDFKAVLSCGIEIIGIPVLNYKCMCMHCEFRSLESVKDGLGFVLGSGRFIKSPHFFWVWYILFGVKN